MKRLWLVFWVVLFLAALPVLAQGPPLGPGGIKVQGSTNEFASFYLDVTLQQADPSQFEILAAKIYAEPSHTLMVAIVSDAAPASVLTDIQSANPVAMAVTSIGNPEGRFGIPPRPPSDSAIRVDYVVRKGSLSSTLTVTETKVGSMSSFTVQSQPLGGGGYIHCGFCGGAYCGCVTCSGPAYNVCCPECSIHCGIYLCP